MRTKQVFARTTALWGLVAATTSMAVLAAKPPAIEDTATNPAPIAPAVKSRPAARPAVSGDEGGTAGTPVLIWDNGTMVTSVGDSGCTPHSDKSLLQNLAKCLNVLGFGVVSTVGIADDFTVTQAVKIERVTVFAYLTGSTATPTITGASVTLHSGRPFTPTSNVIAGPTTLLAGPATFANPKSARMSENTPGCTRRPQQVTIDTSAWPAIPAGNYWISYNVTGASFCPPVTVLGQFKKTGANAMQLSGTNFVGLFDTGATPANCPGYPTDNLLTPGVAAAAQDMPFILEGDLLAACVGDINHDNSVGVADLLAVIGAWGPCGSPCPTDLNGDNTTGVADLLTVISNWGACPPGPPTPPAPATGACTVGATCSTQTFNACFLAGGTYGGDGTGCTGACCAAGSCTQQTAAACASASGVFNGAGSNCPGASCTIPANDTCATATALALGNTTFSNVFANTGGPTANATCTSIANNVTRDVWFTMSTVAAQSYNINTLATGVTTLDTTIEVFALDCNTFTLIACNDDGTVPAGTLLSDCNFTGTGNTVLVRVGSWQNGGVGDITVTRN